MAGDLARLQYLQTFIIDTSLAVAKITSLRSSDVGSCEFQDLRKKKTPPQQHSSDAIPASCQARYLSELILVSQACRRRDNGLSSPAVKGLYIDIL